MPATVNTWNSKAVAAENHITVNNKCLVLEHLD